MNKVSQLKVGVIISYVSMALGYIIMILYTPVMLRILGQSEYGLYNLVASVVSYLGLFSFGFGGAYVRYYFKFKANNDNKGIAKLNGMFLLIFTVIGLVALVAGIILSLNVSFIFGDKLNTYEINTARTLMLIMVFNIAISFPASVFNSHVIANEKYIFQKLLQMIKIVINPFIMLPILLMGYKSVGMVVVTTFITILTEVSSIVFCFKKLKIKFSFKHFDFALMKDITVFSSFLFLNMIIDQINWNVDKFLIGRYQGTVSVAIYGIAAQLNTYYMSVSSAISSVFIPRINNIVSVSNNNKELTYLFTRIGRIQFIILSLVCSGIIFFGKPFINIWAGEDYSDAYTILLLLIVPVTIPLIQNIGIEIQKAKNMHKFRSIAYIIIALGNICISIPLTKLYSGMGAALGTAISLIIGTIIVMNWYYHKRVGINIIYFWKNILRLVPPLIIPALVGLAMCLLFDLYYIPTLLLCGIVYALIFCISMWFIGMNAYEKDLLTKPLLAIMHKLGLNKGR